MITLSIQGGDGRGYVFYFINYFIIYWWEAKLSKAIIHFRNIGNNLNLTFPTLQYFHLVSLHAPYFTNSSNFHLFAIHFIDNYV